MSESDPSQLQNPNPGEENVFDYASEIASDVFNELADAVNNSINTSIQDGRANVARSNAVRILAGKGISNKLISGSVVDQDQLESRYPELSSLIGDKSQGEMILSYPKDMFSEDVNHMILFQMFEKEDEDTRIFNREVDILGNEEIGNLINEINNNFDLADNTQNNEFDNTTIIESDYINTTTLGGQPVYDRSITGSSFRSGSGIVTSRNGNEISYRLTSPPPTRNRDREGKYKANFKSPFTNTGIAKTPQYKAKQNIFLYMPNTINETNIQSYETPELLLATFGAEFLNKTLNAISGEGDYDDVVNQLGNNTRLLTRKGASFLDSITDILQLDLNAEQALTQLTGLAANNRKEQTYQSPDFRTFNYVFDLFPKNRAETEMINAMVRLFKYHSYPDLDVSGNLFVTPAIFRIKYLYKNESGALVENLWLNRIKDCVLTEVAVDYTSPGKFTAFKDGSPVGIKLTLTFRETTVVTKLDVTEGA